jgi:TDG/mug DNA glycosylase family protein
MPVTKPTRADLEAAASNTIPDVIAPHLQVLFSGINPGLYSAFTGFHFARPGNRFWPTLYASGFTDRLLKPSEQTELLARRIGITNLAARASATADELTPQELIEGGKILAAKIETYRPKVLAILGISAYRTAFAKPRALLGRQPEPIGSAILWVMPNPSGLNAHYSAQALAQVFREFRLTIENTSSSL